jgi:hypothetical protein
MAMLLCLAILLVVLAFSIEAFFPYRVHTLQSCNSMCSSLFDIMSTSTDSYRCIFLSLLMGMSGAPLKIIFFFVYLLLCFDMMIVLLLENQPPISLSWRKYILCCCWPFHHCCCPTTPTGPYGHRREVEKETSAKGLLGICVSHL